MKMPIASGVAFGVGVIFPLIFFYFNDPDRAEFSVVAGWFLAVLIPSALAARVKSGGTSLLSAVMMLSGFFIGTCIALVVYYPDKAGLFPIAAAIYTIMAGIPVMLGSAAGSLVERNANRKQ